MAESERPRRDDPPGKSAEELRREAEALVGNLCDQEAASLSDTSDKLVHELRVHQIELEIQNEELRASELATDEARDKYFDLYDHAPIGYVTVDSGGIVIETNLTAAALFGLDDPAHLVAVPLSKFIAAEDQEAFYLYMRALTRSDDPGHRELRVQRDGGVFWSSVHGRIQTSDSSSTGATFRLTFADIDELKRIQTGESRIAARFRAVVESSHDIIYTMDSDGFISFVSPSWASILGHPPSKVVGKQFEDFVHPEDVPRCRAALTRVKDNPEVHADVEYRISCEDGTWRWFESTLAPELDDRGAVVEYVANARDVTDRKLDLERMETMAMTDELTEIGNRRQFLVAAATEFQRARRHGHELSLLLADLDDLKTINDTYGHPVGDLALKHVAAACAEIGREADAAGRLGGDEFGVLLPHSDVTAAFSVGERLREKVAERPAGVPLPEGLEPTVSVGVSSVAPDDADYTGLLRRADHALYRAKESGRNRTRM